MTAPDFQIPNWTDDLEFGEAGEGAIQDILGRLAGGSVEAKTERRPNGRHYVELWQHPNRTLLCMAGFECMDRAHWKPSGVLTSEADWWVVYWPDVPSVLVVPTDRLRQWARRTYKKPGLDGGAAGANPTKGLLATAEQLAALSLETA